MSRFTDLFQLKPAASVVKEPVKGEAVSKSINKIVDIDKWKNSKNNK